MIKTIDSDNMRIKVTIKHDGKEIAIMDNGAVHVASNSFKSIKSTINNLECVKHIILEV